MSEQEQNQLGLNEPTVEPTAEPTIEPTADSTVEPTAEPTADEKNTQKDSGEQNIVPETYDFKDLKLPEGFEIGKSLVDKFSPIGKELNLSQEAANKLANILVEFQQEQLAQMPEKIAEQKKQEKEAIKLSYEKLLNTDKVICPNGDKDKMNSYLDVADIGYKNFATDELKGVLQELSLDYHPAVIKLFHKLGTLCGNDKITNPQKPVGTKQDIADILYSSNSEEKQ